MIELVLALTVQVVFPEAAISASQSVPVDQAEGGSQGWSVNKTGSYQASSPRLRKKAVRVGMSL